MKPSRSDVRNRFLIAAQTLGIEDNEKNVLGGTLSTLNRLLCLTYLLLLTKNLFLIYSYRSAPEHNCTIIKMAESSVLESSKCPLVFLGKTGLKVSNICLGAMTFGKSVVSNH